MLDEAQVDAGLEAEGEAVEGQAVHQEGGCVLL